jgi:hypothetical protein
MLNTIHFLEDISMAIIPISGFMYNDVFYDTKEEARQHEKRDQLMALATTIFPNDPNNCVALVTATYSDRWQEFVDLAAS